MKRILTLALGLLASCVIATPQETKEAKIERILAATNSTAMMDQIITQVRTLAASQLPPGSTPEQQSKAAELTAKMMELMKSRMDKIHPDLVKAYAETFSDQEIDAMLAFYESPAGRAMLQKMPAVTGRIMGLMQSQMGDMMVEIQRLTRETAPPKPAN